MSQSAPAVVLLFDDAELGGHLRDALRDRGAHIVHEGGVDTLSRELLERVGADVLVINLDDAADDALDRLYDVVDGDRPRVVFNDAQASRALTGWDRARWARHLAVKVLATGDLDPPRPAMSPGLGNDVGHDVGDAVDEVSEAASASAADIGPVSERPVVDGDLSIPTGNDAPAIDASSSALETHPAALDEDALPGSDSPRGQAAGETAEDLSAELEALLAADDLSTQEDIPAGPGLRFTDGEEPPPLHDGHFGPPTITETASSAEPAPALPVASEEDEHRHRAVPTVFEHSSQELKLELEPLADIAAAPVDAAPAAPAPLDVSAPSRVSDSWSLLDDEDVPESPVSSKETVDATDSGIQKDSATDFLAFEDAPMVADQAPMGLSLQSPEDAMAPQTFKSADAMHASRLDKVVLLGAAAESGASVRAFLCALPSTSQLTFVLTQHLGGTPVDELVDALAESSPLPVRAATHGDCARAGEVVVVPAGQQLILIRDGSMELTPASGHASRPSIDATFSMAANVFGRDALAIVFAGRGTDAVAGAQAVHDRGGEVWVEASAGDHPDDMVSGISAERLAGFSGTPHQLASHLLEVFA